MIKYAVYECTILTELYLIMYTEKVNFNKTTSSVIYNHQDSSIDICDEEIGIYIP